MTKWKVLGGAVSVLCIGVMTATLLPATGQISGKRFVLCEKNGPKDYEKDVDVRPNGFSAGDQFLFSEPEFDEAGRKVGKIVGSGRVIRTFGERDALVQFNVSLNLDGGRIEIQASSKFTNTTGATFAIVGGTGRYAGKTGTVKVRSRRCDGVGKKGDSLVVRFE
ncbi:MAG: allene oxide cyclase barrel-like domain-containing protein [Actinomycetota bacterium]